MPHNITPTKITILLKTAQSFKIFLYPRGWFDKLQEKITLPFSMVNKGEHVIIFMNLHVLKRLPKTGIYKYTAPSKKNCIKDTRYDLDIITQKKVFKKFNATYGCILPFYGGMVLGKDFDICTNTSIYSLKVLLSFYQGKH